MIKRKNLFLSFLVGIQLLITYVHAENRDRPKETDLLFTFNERVYKGADGEHSKWVNVPIKILSYPITKIQYEVIQHVTSLVTESINRSPVHNFLGTVDEVKRSYNLVAEGFISMGKGIANPTNGALIDGLLEILDGALNSIRIAGGLIKTGVSTIAYPIYRMFGGDPSRRNAIKGKRAAIVLVNTGFFPMDTVLDPYGEQIVKYHLKGVADYYCVRMWNEGSAYECLDKVPEDIEYIDFVALEHTGGTRIIESLAVQASQRGFKPGLLLSIGCYDGASALTDPDNAMGQDGLSWAIHYYLSNAISKRLRGIPIQDAAKEAFVEGIPVNFLNPISLLGMAATGGLDGSIPTVNPPKAKEDSDTDND